MTFFLGDTDILYILIC